MERHIQQNSRWHFCIAIFYLSFGLGRQMKLYRDPLPKILNKNLTWWWLWEGEDNPKLRSPDVRLSFQGSSNKTSKPKSLTSVAHDGPWNPWNQIPVLNLKHKRGNRNWNRTHLYCKKVIPKLPCFFWCWQIRCRRVFLGDFITCSPMRINDTPWSITATTKTDGVNSAKFTQMQKIAYTPGVKHGTWKMMVGRWSFPFGMAYFQGRTVKLPGGVHFFSGSSPKKWIKGYNPSTSRRVWKPRCWILLDLYFVHDEIMHWNEFVQEINKFLKHNMPPKKHQWCLNFKLSEMNVFHVILFIKIIFFNIIFTQILCRIDEIQIGDCWKITVWCPKGEGCLHWIQSLCIWKHWNIIFDSQHECSNTPKPMSYPFISYNLYDILLYQFSTSIYQRPLPHCLIRDGEAPLMIHSTPLGRNRYLCIISMSTNPITLPHTTQIPLPKSGNGMRSFWEGLVLLVPAEIPNILGGSSQDL